MKKLYSQKSSQPVCRMELMQEARFQKIEIIMYIIARDSQTQSIESFTVIMKDPWAWARKTNKFDVQASLGFYFTSGYVKSSPSASLIIADIQNLNTLWLSNAIWSLEAFEIFTVFLVNLEIAKSDMNIVNVLHHAQSMKKVIVRFRQYLIFILVYGRKYIT